MRFYSFYVYKSRFIAEHFTLTLYTYYNYYENYINIFIKFIICSLNQIEMFLNLIKFDKF